MSRLQQLANLSFRARPGAMALVFLGAACSETPTALPPDGVIDLSTPWEVVEPDQVGLDPLALEAAGDAAALETRFRSLLVVRRGFLAYERYFGGTNASTLADVRSVTKSIVSTLTGAAIARGQLEGLDQPIGQILGLPEFPLTEEQASITIRHLLTMSGGFAWEGESGGGYNAWITADDHVGYLLSQPIAQTPGSTFLYNSAAVHLLGVVLEEATGRTLPDYSNQVLFGPLAFGPRTWEDLSGGRVNGGSGIDLRPRDLARFGQLMLQQGWSGSRSVIPVEWVGEATATRFRWTSAVCPLNRISYGFLWWTDLDRGAYFAWGFGGQFVYVHPGLQMVVVATTDWRNVSQDGGPRPLEVKALSAVVAMLEAAS